MHGEITKKYRFAITPSMQEKVEAGKKSVSLQFLPQEKELATTEDELLDPISDQPFSPLKGIVHRHKNRLLFLPILSCPVYCRFCFRKEVVGKERGLNQKELERALCYIEAQKEVEEVIFSGGDPLMMKPSFLGKIMQRLQKMEHIEIIRFHTRVPVVDPGRVTEALLNALEVDKALYVILHTNSIDEWDDQSVHAIKMLKQKGISLLSQTVLLKGVNDDPLLLKNLFSFLVKRGVKPYYLHHLDLAKGTSHFRVSLERGQKIVAELREMVSGLMMPTYVLDIPGGFGKVPIEKEHLFFHSEGTVSVKDLKGCLHPLPPTLNRE